MSRNVALLLILVFLTGACITAPLPVKAEYQGNITINADGSISPSTVPIQQTGDTYRLTGNVVGSISVLRSNMVFDGNGHSLIALGVGHGVEGLSVGHNPYSSPPVATGATNVTVKNLNVKGSLWGISLIETLNALIINNTVSDTGYGPPLYAPTGAIYISGGGSNTITGNNLVNNYVGIYCIETQNNLIVRNDVVNCSTVGGGGPAIVFWGASNNIIYHNSFINNLKQAYDDSFNSPFSTNTWDDGYPSGGNYWSDYLARYPNATEVDNSGIGDTPYIIDAQNKDRYPLMVPFNVASPRISVLSPINQVFNESSVPLAFNVNKPALWTGYSLDGQHNVTISGNTTITDLTNGLHNVTVYARDEFDNVGASETIIFNVEVPEPFPTTIVLASVIIVAAISIGVLVYFKKRKH